MKARGAWALLLLAGCFRSSNDPCDERMRPVCADSVEVDSCEGWDTCFETEWCGGTLLCASNGDGGCPPVVESCPFGYEPVESCEGRDNCILRATCEGNLACASICGGCPEGTRRCEAEEPGCENPFGDADSACPPILCIGTECGGCDAGETEVEFCEPCEAGCRELRCGEGRTYCRQNELLCDTAEPCNFAQVAECPEGQRCNVAADPCGGTCNNSYCVEPCPMGSLWVPEGPSGCPGPFDCSFVEHGAYAPEGFERTWCRMDPESTLGQCGAVPVCPESTTPELSYEQLELLDPCPVNANTCFFETLCGASIQCAEFSVLAPG